MLLTNNTAKLITQIALLILLCSITALFVSKTEAGAKNVSGYVVNKTQDASVDQNIQIQLFAIENSTGRVVETHNTQLSNGNRFSFQNVAEGGDIAYRVVAIQEGYSPFVDILPSNDSTNIPITVWEHTTDPSIIRFGTYSILASAVSGEERKIAFLASVVIHNPTDKVWVAKPITQGITGPDLFRFNLPEGYQDLSVETNLPAGSVLEISTGFALTTPVPPGEHSLIMSYTVNYDKSSFSAPFRLAHGATKFIFLLPTDAGYVTGNRLVNIGSVDTPVGNGKTVTFDSYQGDNYEPGSQITLTINQLPQPPLLQRTIELFKDTNSIIFISAVSIGILLLPLSYLIYKRRQSYQSVEGEPNTQTDSLSVMPSTLLDLDQKYRVGEITTDDYLQQREDIIQAILKASNKKDSDSVF